MRNVIATNLFALLWAAWRRRYLIIVPIVIMPIIGLAAGLTAPKRYVSYTTILIQEAAKQNPFLEDFAVATNIRARMEALNALLHSRHVLGEVLSRLHGEALATLGESEVDREMARLSQSLSATLVGDDLVEIRLVSDDPDGMVAVLELVSESFIERVVAPQKSSVRNSEIFLQQELERWRADLETAERAVAVYKTRFASQLPELHTANVARLSELRRDLGARRTDLRGVVAAHAALSLRLSRTNPAVGRIEEDIVDSLAELASLRARYTDRHSSVQAAQLRLRALEDQRAIALASAREPGSADIDRLWNMATTSGRAGGGEWRPLLVAQLQSLQQAEARAASLEEEVRAMTVEVDVLAAAVSAFGENERRLTELERDLNVKRRLYEDLAERHQLARVTGSLGAFEEDERIKIIDPPFRPPAPSNFSLALYVIGALVGGIALGVGLALMSEVMDSTVRRRDVLEALMGAPVISRIPVLAAGGIMPGRDEPASTGPVPAHV